MKYFEYGDPDVSHKEILVAIPSMVIGVGILTLPRLVAQYTKATDGWISIIIAGGISILFAWICGKLACRFPRQSFFEYTASITTKPVSIVLTLLIAIHAMSIAAYEMRSVANIAKVYLFDQTPVEILALLFHLLVIYGVWGIRASILRVNMMFIPLVLTVGAGVILMNFHFMDIDNMKPVFTTPLKGYVWGAKESLFSFLGFSFVILFYTSLIRNEKYLKRVPRACVIGSLLPVMFYLITYLSAIAVFGSESTSTIIDPTIEMAKEVEVPGEFFERFESLFFTIWVMTIFNTTAMSYDIALICFQSIFRRLKKHRLILILSPIIYLSGMLPPNLVTVFELGDWISYAGIALGMMLPLLLLLMAVARGVKGNA